MWEGVNGVRDADALSMLEAGKLRFLVSSFWFSLCHAARKAKASGRTDSSPPRFLASFSSRLFGSAFAADRPAEPLRLWAGKAPGALGDADKDTPTLTPYWPAPEQASGARPPSSSVAQAAGTATSRRTRASRLPSG